MKIRKIQFKNGYKRFFDLTIDLGDTPKRIVALVGPNGCGKSSVFDGMLYLHSANVAIGKYGRKGFEYHSMASSPNYNQENILINFIEGEFSTVFQTKNNNGNSSTLFSFRSPYRYNINLKVNESKRVDNIALNNYGASSTSDLDDKMEDSYRRLRIKFTDYLEQAQCNTNEARIKIIGDLNNSITKCLDLEISKIGDIEAGKGSLYFRKPGHKTEFEFNVLSSGEKEVVDILLDLYLRQDEYTDSIFLIDEPELHINTSVQKNLLIEINKLIGVNCQIWIATHSIGFLRALQDELKDDCQIINFENIPSLASDTIVLTPMQKSRSNWSKVFHTALDDLTGLISPKTIIYCEGKPESNNYEEKGFDAIIYGIIFQDNTDVDFISSGGGGAPKSYSGLAVEVFKKIHSGQVQVLILKDGDNKDSAGGLISVDARKKALEKDKNLRVLSRREIENYLCDKAVLQLFKPDLNVIELENINFQSDCLKSAPNKKLICNILDIKESKWEFTLKQLAKLIFEHKSTLEIKNIYNTLKADIFVN